MRTAQTVWLLAMVFCFTLTSCEKDEDEEGRPYYSRFVDINITRCERVGGVLVIDFELTNKKDVTLSGTLTGQNVIDNTGNKYPTLVWGSGSGGRTAVAIADGLFYDKATFHIVGKGTIVGHLKVYGYDPNDKSSSVSVEMRVGIDNENLADKLFEASKIGVTDNRVKKHGVQTNDTRLAYQVTSCTFKDGVVDVQFTVTNNFGDLLKGLELSRRSDAGGYVAYDDLGNNYIGRRGTRFLCQEGADWGDIIHVNLSAGTTIKVTARVTDVKSNANELSLSFLASTENYVCEDEVVRFLSIPIEK